MTNDSRRVTARPPDEPRHEPQVVELSGKATGSALTQQGDAVPSMPRTGAEANPGAVRERLAAAKRAAVSGTMDDHCLALEMVSRLWAENPMDLGPLVVCAAQHAGKDPRSITDRQLIAICEQLLAAGGSIGRPH